MPARFSRSDIEALANLAQLELDEQELDLFARQLGDILGYVTQIQSIDTTNIPPTASVLRQLDTDRGDEVKPSLDRREALANAPDSGPEIGLFKVPQVIG